MIRMLKRNTAYASVLSLVLSSLFAGQPVAMALVPTQAAAPAIPTLTRHRNFDGTVGVAVSGPLSRVSTTRGRPNLHIVVEAAEPEPLAAAGNHSLTQALQHSPDGGWGAPIMDQAHLVYSGLPSTVAAFGRQQLNPDGSRFDSTVSRRKRGLSFDTITIANTALPKTRVNYAYLFDGRGVSGLLSPSSQGATSSHIVDVVNDALAPLEVNLYGYRRACARLLRDLQGPPLWRHRPRADECLATALRGRLRLSEQPRQQPKWLWP
jgi:hypothetical protein